MQPLRPLLLLAVLAGARANCVDPGSVSRDEVGTKYCCPGIASELTTGQGCCSNRISGDCDAGTVRQRGERVGEMRRAEDEGLV